MRTQSTSELDKALISLKPFVHLDVVKIGGLCSLCTSPHQLCTKTTMGASVCAEPPGNSIYIRTNAIERKLGK